VYQVDFIIIMMKKLLNIEQNSYWKNILITNKNYREI
jgi:hypothetical protein